MPAPPGEPVSQDGSPAPPVDPEAVARHNLIVESLFSSFNGVFMGMILFAAPIIAVSCLDATTVQVTIIACAFPCGAFLGPFWATLGRHWGMKKLVTQMAVWANLPLFLMFWVHDAALFTAVITVSQLLHSGMRMGQSSMYRTTYPRGVFGRVLGQLTALSFFSMVISVLITGWLSDTNREVYRVLFPIAAVFGLIGCQFYARLRILEPPPPAPPVSLRAGLKALRRVIHDDRPYLLFQIAFFLSGSAFFMSAHVVLMMSEQRLQFRPSELALWLSVVPQLVLALSSPLWGLWMDKIGIVRARLIISTVMTAYLALYFGGILLELPLLLYMGSVLRGVAEGGGQVTWALASSHFAPRAEDVPLYNGIHFVLNGIRGLVMPWVGSLLFVLFGAWTILVSTGVSAASIVVIMYSLRQGEEAAERAEVAALGAAEGPE